MDGMRNSGFGGRNDNSLPESVMVVSMGTLIHWPKRAAVGNDPLVHAVETDGSPYVSLNLKLHCLRALCGSQMAQRIHRVLVRCPG